MSELKASDLTAVVRETYPPPPPLAGWLGFYYDSGAKDGDEFAGWYCSGKVHLEREEALCELAGFRPFEGSAIVEIGQASALFSPAQPEPKREEVCPECRHATYHDPDCSLAPDEDEPAPSPAPVNGNTPIGQYDPDMKPAPVAGVETVSLSAIEAEMVKWGEEFDKGAFVGALIQRLRRTVQPAPVAGELAHEVKAAWAELKSASALSRRDGWFESSACQDKAADDLKSWARSQATAQPVAVGMSEELKVVLEMADFGAMKLLERGFDNTKERKAILAVRAQAASAQPGRDLPKVRELIGWFKADCRPYKSAKESSALRDAALAELDAQPKAVEVPVEAIRRYVNGDAQIEDEKKVVRWIAQVEEGE